MSPFILPVPHKQQEDQADCLAACAAMIFAYHQIRMPYRRIRKQLKVRQYGTPFFNLARLDRHFDVHIARGNVGIIMPTLLAHTPLIVSVLMGELPHYANDNDSRHAVVIVGMNRETNKVYLNDPALPQGGLAVSLGDFDLAWLAQRERYALLTPR